jgi:serine/threonine-protein kinase HipA
MTHKALIKFHNIPCGIIEEIDRGRKYRFTYREDYQGPDISLTMPVRSMPYEEEGFLSFFDGLLPEGQQLDALLRIHKIDQNDYLSQLIAVGADLVGAVTVFELDSGD